MAILFDERGNQYTGALDIITGQTVTDPRAATAILGALNAESVMDINGHSTARVDVRAIGSMTLVFQATTDGVNYDTLTVINEATQAMVQATTANGRFVVNVTGYRRFRVLVSAYTSGTVTIAMRATMAEYAMLAIPYPATTTATNTAATGIAMTLTVAAGGVGLFHYFTRIIVQRHTSALLTAGTTPVLVTTTNLPGARVFSIPADAAAQGTVYSEIVEPTQPLKSTAANTATTIVCPATTGVIWRVTADYYLGA